MIGQQLLAILFGTGVALGASAAVAFYSITPPKRRKIKAINYKEVKAGSNHFTVAHAQYVKAFAKSLRWYGPSFSPKDVPRFYDVSGLTENPVVFRQVIDVFVARFSSLSPPVTHIAGYDARGFLLAAPVALEMGIPCLLLRKDAKSPGVLVESAGYAKEYQEHKPDKMSLRVGSLKKGDRVVLIDDLIATGGTALAGFEVVHGLGASVAEFAAVVSLPVLKGIDKIRTANSGRYKELSVFTLLDDDAVADEMGRDPRNWQNGSRIIPHELAEELRKKHSLT